MSAKLRIGAVVDALVLPRWIVGVLEQVDAAPDFDLVVLAIGRCATGPDARRGVYSLYEAIDRAVFADEDDPLALKDVAGRFPDATRLPIELPLDAHAVEELRGRDLDVVLSLSAASPPSDAWRAARHGVWSFAHGDGVEQDGAPPLFWELRDRRPVTVTELAAQREGARHVIYRSFSATDPVSLQRSRSRAYWKASAFALRRLNDLAIGGWERVQALAPEDDGVYPPARKRPASAVVGAHIARVAGGVLRRRFVRVGFKQQWCVAFRRRAGSERALDPAAHSFTFLEPGKDRYHADPFLIERGGRTYLFFEEFKGELGRGTIAYVEIHDDGTYSAPRTALERPYHLSYPFVFEHEGELYMVPETAKARRVEVYRAVEFPDRWQLTATPLRDIVAVDPTLLAHDGRLWLFANVAVPGANTHDELFLFHSDSLDGEWLPHERNPVVSDVRRARPAGRIFSRDGTLIRLGQDSSRDYGHAIAINRIEVLDEHEYVERQIGRIGPDWWPGNLASHSYSFTDAWEAIDSRALRPRNRLVEPLRPYAVAAIAAFQKEAAESPR